MQGSRSASRSMTGKKDGTFRYATRLLAMERGRRSSQIKESPCMKACEYLLKSDGWKGTRHASKAPAKRSNGNKSAVVKDTKNKPSNHREKVVIVSKRSSSVSVVKSCRMKKSVSVKKVSYSTSVVLSSEEEEEEESDSDDDSDDDVKDEYLKTRRTVVKRTTSKIKSNYRAPRKCDTRSNQKAKAIKILRDKLASTNRRKQAVGVRELRPRFPYSSTQEWPTARAHRVAGLNALAKVHVLYENEGNNANENEADHISLSDFLDDSSDEEKIIKKEIKAAVKNKNDKAKNLTSSTEKTENKKKGKVVKRRRKRKVSSDVEIIDTKICKRMASLNAQAILAASYIQEKPRKLSRKHDKCEDSQNINLEKMILESKCDIKLIETDSKSSDKTEINDSYLLDNIDEDNSQKGVMDDNHFSSLIMSPKICSPKISSPIPLQKPDKEPTHESIPVGEDATTSTVSQSTTTSTQVGVTKYTEVTKVQINTRKEVEIKEESKSEKKIERIVGSDDVAITQLYHYQSQNANESYCVQMQTTYKPGSKNFASTSAAVSSPHSSIHSPDSALPGRPNYYVGPNTILPPHPYQINHNPGGIPPHVMGMDHIPRQYGSAFSVPHYGHPQTMPFSKNDYGYYQPAGPLIQSHHDQYTIHKPVPYHPQPHLHHSPQRSQHKPANMDPYSPIDSRQHQPPSIPSHFPLTSKQNLSSDDPHNRPIVDQQCRPPMHCQDQKKEKYYHSMPYAHASTKPASTMVQSSYPLPSSRREFQMQRPAHESSPKTFPKHYEDKTYPSKHSEHGSLSPYNSAYHSRVGSQWPPPPAHHGSDHRRDISGHSTQALSSFPFSNITAHSNSPESTTHDASPLRNHIWGGESKHRSMLSPMMSYSPQSLIKKSPDPNQQQLRPPSVIEIDDNNCRDTKTYIQLEVPTDHYREKIVVVDVENDDCPDLDNNLRACEPEQNLNLSQGKSTSESNESILLKKGTKHADECIAAAPEQKESEATRSDTPDIMVIEVKKQKESAVVRRARLHGKQRTFRDYYNRPLAPLSKTKKIKLPSIDEQHLSKSFQPLVSLSRLVLPKSHEKKYSHRWSWEGAFHEKLIYISNDDPPVLRKCYDAVRHDQGDVINARDCVLLKQESRRSDLPFVAKVTDLWENPSDGEMMMSLLWYYHPEQTEQGRNVVEHCMDNELFASKHKDVNNVACIEDKCYVLTYAEYCRYQKKCKVTSEGCDVQASVVPECDDYPRKNRLPPSNVSAEMVFFCRSMYDYRQKRLLKNP